MIPDVLFDVKYNLSGTLLLTEQLLVLELTFQNDFFRKAFKFFFYMRHNCNLGKENEL